MSDLLLGGFVVMLAGLLSGATGFGFGLLSAPLLLLIGFPLEFVVTANLTLALLTRISVIYQLRTYLNRRRATVLIVASIPGLLLGTQVLTSVDPSVIKRATGVLVMIATALLVRARHHPPPRALPGGTAAAGFLGGFLGATTSLNGVPAVLLLTRDRVRPASFLVDLAAYFVVSNTIALGLLWARGALAHRALFPDALLWLPGTLIGNYLGVILSTRLPEGRFRHLTIAVAFLSGAVTLLTA